MADEEAEPVNASRDCISTIEKMNFMPNNSLAGSEGDQKSRTERIKKIGRKHS